MLPKFYRSTIIVLSKYYQSNIIVLSKYYQSTIIVLSNSKYYQSTIIVLSKYYQSTIKVLSKYYFGRLLYINIMNTTFDLNIDLYQAAWIHKNIEIEKLSIRKLDIIAYHRKKVLSKYYRIGTSEYNWSTIRVLSK